MLREIGGKEKKGSSCNSSIPSGVEEEVAKYAYSDGTQAAINRLKSKTTPFFTYIYQLLQTYVQ